MSIWNKLSMLLMMTNEKAHLLLTEPIILETNEDQGLSSLQKPCIKEIWQDTREGIISFKYEGCNEEFDLSEYPEFIPQIYDALLNNVFD